MTMAEPACSQAWCSFPASQRPYALLADKLSKLLQCCCRINALPSLSCLLTTLCWCSLSGNKHQSLSAQCCPACRRNGLLVQQLPASWLKPWQHAAMGRVPPTVFAASFELLEKVNFCCLISALSLQEEDDDESVGDEEEEEEEAPKKKAAKKPAAKKATAAKGGVEKKGKGGLPSCA